MCNINAGRGPHKHIRPTFFRFSNWSPLYIILDSGQVVSPSAFSIIHFDNTLSLKVGKINYMHKLYPSLNGMQYSTPGNILYLQSYFCQIIW